MKNSFKKFLVLSTAIVGAATLSVSDASAAGFQLKEQGAQLQGLSFAGATARANDLSTVFFNPAGMTRLNGHDAQLNVSFIRPSAELSLETVTPPGGGITNPAITDGNGGDAGSLEAVPAIYTMWTDPNHPEWRFGVSINTPFGLSTSYNDGWAGRYYALDSELQTITVAPAVAYKVNNNLSIGAAGTVEYIRARLTKNANIAAATVTPGAPDGYVKLAGDDVALGYKISALYEYDENTRVGVNYDSRVKHDLHGRISVTNIAPALAANPNFRTADAEAPVELPDVLSLGVYHKFDQDWAVLADVAWTNWSLFDSLVVTESATGTVRENIDEGYSDTLFAALGFEHNYDESTLLQFGVAYDQGAVDNERRTFRIPDTDRYWMSAGIVHELDDALTLSAGYTYIHAKDATVNEDAGVAQGAGIVSGEFDSNVNILSLNATYRF